EALRQAEGVEAHIPQDGQSEGQGRGEGGPQGGGESRAQGKGGRSQEAEGPHVGRGRPGQDGARREVIASGRRSPREARKARLALGRGEIAAWLAGAARRRRRCVALASQRLRRGPVRSPPTPGRLATPAGGSTT